MKIIRKIKIKTKKYTIRRFKILDCIPLLDYIKIDRKNKKTLKFYYFAKHSSPKKNQRIFYLKVHNINKTSIDCIRQWVKIADKMNAFIYFVCDNKHMQNEIFRNVIFKHCGFEFIETDKSSIKIVNSLIKNSNKLWKRIAKPMITPFLHAKKYGYNISYNIDADDILLPSSLEKLYKVFISSESKVDIIAGNYARVTQNTTDIYCSRTYSGLVREKDKYKYFFLNKFAMCPGSTLINKNLLRNIRYNERFCRYEDLDFMLRLMHNATIYVIPDILFEYCLDYTFASRPLSDIGKDFLFSMDFKGKTFWEKCILGEALYYATFSYPSYRLVMRKKYRQYWAFIYIANFLKKGRKLYRKVLRK